MWEIKGKDNQVKATVGSLEYNGEWMGESYVTVTVESPAPVNFEIGDYIIYRDERFEINYDPGKIKSAPRYEKGDAFKYENIKFNSLADELTRCDFLDIVLNDNQLHFTGLPKFSFYGGVKDLANRMQANLDRTYGKGTWSVVVSPEFQSTKEVNISVDTIKVQGALSILVNELETYYTIKDRTITIGAAGIPAGHLFKYGRGNGLYEIEQNAEADQAIVTRLRAYGSTRNLPHRYYNSLSGADGKKLIPDNMAVQYLMLPEFPYTTQDPYIDSPNIAKLGVREGTVFFDGSGELEEIYPSIEGMTAEQLKAAGVPCNSTGALDEIVSAEQMTDNGVGEINEGETQTTAKPPTFKVTLKDLGFDINDHKTTETATISFKTGMLGGRDFEIVGCKKIESGGKVTGYELELNRVYDDGIKLWFPYKDYNAKAGDKIVILYIDMPEVYIKANAQKLKEVATEWLSKNDYSRSIYAPKVDEIFMARQHDLAMASGGKIKSLHDTLKEGMLLLFGDEDLNIDASIFIDRLTIKEGNSPTPTYEVVLKEEKTVGRLDKMQNQIDSLVAGKGQGGNGGYTAAQMRQLIEAYGGTRFLSKIKDDRTPHKVSTDKAFEVGEYLAGVSGGVLGKDSNGDSFAEVARLYVRVKAFFEELTVVKSGVIAGKNYITPGGGISCTKVDENASAYRCYFLCEQDGEKIETKFIVNDQAISQTFNAKTGTSNKIDNHRYWRLVTAVNNDAYTDDAGNHYGYIDLSKSICEAGSSIPKAGDEICQLGYQGADNPQRQTAMVFSTVDADAPSIKMFSGINSFSLDGKAIISFGRDPITEQVYFRLGASRAKQYLEYTQDNGLKIAGKISNLSTIGDTLIGDYITETANDLLQVEYSQTGADNTWHKVWQEADKYMRQSKDGGKTWTGAMLISGKDGSSFANNLLWNSNFQNGRTSWDDWGGGNTSRILVTEDDKKWMHIITRGDSFQGISQGDTNRIYAQEKTYTVSALVRSNTAGQHISLNIHCISSTGVNLIGIDNRFDVGTTPQRVSATFKAVAGTTRLRLMVGAATTDPIEVYVTDLKIEEGENSSTQWTPNPEEMIGKDAPYTVFQWAIGDFTQPTGTWSNHPLNPKPGEAVWMRQGTVTPPSTTPMWDTSNYMRVTGTAGQSGSDVYLLDIDNEVIAVACDSGGNPLLGQFPVKATARVYKGGTEVTSGVAFSSEYNPEVSATLSGGDITIGGLYADTATLTITATVAGLTLYSTIRLYKVKPGINGAPAVVYSIEPSVSVVTKSLTTGLSANQLTCTKYKTTGASARTTTKENILKATVYTNGVAGTEQIIANATKETGTVALTNDTTGVAFALCNSSSGVELDREFVPVISDASGLQIGGTNLLRKTNQGTENWMTSTSSGAEINLSPADDAQGVVLTNMATGAVLSSGWQMIGFRLPPGILKTQRYYTLSFTAKADALMTVSGRIQISGSTGANLMSNILSFNFSPDETRHTFLLKTNSTAQTNAHSLWCYLFCNAKWNTIEIRDLKLEEGTVATEWSPAPQDFNYLTAALQESGRSEGGLILASLLRLGYTVEDGEYRVMSGINGIANPAAENRDIAIWAGGEMRDATDPENSDYDDNAAYAIRHDGNGYACQGNVRFIGGRILIGKNRDVTGKIKSDSDFAKNCVALDGEGLTLYKNGVERLIVADRSVGTDFISKEETTNWRYAVRSPQELLFKQYHTHTEGLMGPDGEIITQPVDSYDWFATGKVAEILNISPGATAYPNRIIPVGEVLNVSNFTTHITNISFTGQYVHLTATLQLCYDDSSGKRVVVATGKRSFVRNSATPSRWQATISLGKHTVQVAAAYYLNVVVNTTTPTHGKETGTSVSSKVNMSASGDVRKSNDNVTIIGIDGMVSLWGNGGILINSNGAMIKGSLKVNGKNVQTMS